MSVETKTIKKKNQETEPEPWHSKYEVLNEPEVKYEEIAKLEIPIRNILEQLRSRIESGDYGLIIGDDASGRVVTLIFDKVINWIYAERGLEFPKTIFIAGSRMLGRDLERDEKEGRLRGYLRQFKDYQNNRRVLIVTEEIISGGGLEPLVFALDNLKMKCDIASVRYDPRNTYRFNRYTSQNVHVYGGDENASTAYGMDTLRGGVYKVPGELFSFSKKKKILEYDSITKQSEADEFQKKINEIRDDVDIVAQRLLDWYDHGDEKVDEQK